MDLKAYIHESGVLPSEEQQIFIALFSEKKLHKNEYFAREGEFSKDIGFITKGVLRAFYRNTKGDEYNKTFFIENYFVGAYSSLITGQKNLINIQCLTDCVFQVAGFKQVTQLYDRYPKIERLARILAEQFFVIKEQREIELTMLDATVRYTLFKQRYPGLENQIAQYHIASYLSITPTQLSRIRAKK